MTTLREAELEHELRSVRERESAFTELTRLLAPTADVASALQAIVEQATVLAGASAAAIFEEFETNVRMRAATHGRSIDRDGWAALATNAIREERLVSSPHSWDEAGIGASCAKWAREFHSSQRILDLQLEAYLPSVEVHRLQSAAPA